MAQEFKLYDEKFKHNRSKTFDNICQKFGRPADEDWCFKKSWFDFMPGWEYAIHGRDEIRNAVYLVKDAEDWQFFRVGLHGLTTDCKLWCLAWYYAQDKTLLRKMRVDNYLGALIRGGQLNSALEIVR